MVDAAHEKEGAPRNDPAAQHEIQNLSRLVEGRGPLDWAGSTVNELLKLKESCPRSATRRQCRLRICAPRLPTT